MENLSMSVQYIKGIGPKKAYNLKRLNIVTIEDLIYFVPRDYEDRTSLVTLKESNIGEKNTLEVEITGVANIIRPRKNMSILKIPIKDNSTAGYLTWFNQEYLKDKFKIGEIYRVNGKVNKMGLEFQIMNPAFETLDQSQKTGRILPVYALTEGVTNNEMIRIVNFALNSSMKYIEEVLPTELREKYKLLGIHESLKNIHNPKNMDLLKKSRYRLVFEELLILQLGLFIIKNKSYSKESGISFNRISEMDDFINDLPFNLTGAQNKVLKEIEDDMDKPKQMNRLVQGDVGSGKTVVAVLAMFRAVKEGYQAAMMAPTEILATQHFESLTNFFKEYGIRCELLVGSLTSKNKEKVLMDLREGNIDIIVGTHAIIQENVEFYNLGLAITDEQHRFGVKQRSILNQKGANPDILVMTATPIPRTLALILYGDLDISIIDELPPGRKEIETFAVGFDMVERVNKFIEKQLLEGRQAYIVCPLIEESETLDVNSAEELYETLKMVFNNYKVGLLHGRMKSKDKDETMNNFKNHELDILVSTTVIEVGVNVPNSNIMVIYNSERFGLAQLHQLRGRVGRGEYQSYCILLNGSKKPIARERMRILQASSDGFQISERDLELRGPGEFFGTKQHGLPELKIANLIRDIDILKLVQKEAQEIMIDDHNLSSDKYKYIRFKIIEMFKNIGNDLIFN
jgi:ATP-dependent DNA helicase RecG